jgi:serine/threonine protein kinase
MRSRQTRRELAEAVDHIHARGVLHRDIKLYCSTRSEAKTAETFS